MATKKTDYQTLNKELEAVLQKLQGGELTIDEALPAYERGVELVALLEKQLTTAQNRVTELQAKLQDS
jgi:exodeoxyribonuclease VII small subunit